MAKDNQDELDKLNPDFVQLYKENMSYLGDLVRTNPVAAEIFLFISQNMNKQNALACPYSVLQEVTGKSRPTVGRAIKVLKEGNYLSSLRMGTTNVFIANPSIVWTAWRTSKKYCAFDGKILVSKSENKAIEEQLKKMNVPLFGEK